MKDFTNFYESSDKSEASQVLREVLFKIYGSLEECFKYQIKEFPPWFGSSDESEALLFLRGTYHISMSPHVSVGYSLKEMGLSVFV